MATIKSSLALNDRMSPALKSITKAMNSTLQAMRQIKGQNLGEEFAEAAADVKLATMQVEDFSEAMQKNNSKSASSFGGLGRAIKGVITAYSALKVIQTSDQMTSAQARLDLIKREGEMTDELADKIYTSSQRSRASYLETMDAVTKLGLNAGKAFGNTDEIIKFTELLNKNFVVGGASATEQAAAMYQLTQAMGAGKLQGDEYRSIIENAPLLARAIEDYMINVEGAKGSMKEWAADGLLTADVIKQAMFRSSEDIEARFAKMPITFEQAWTMFKSSATKAFEPVLKLLSKLLQGLSGFLNFLANNAELFYIFGAAVAALGLVYLGIQAPIIAATIAQWAMNSALLACPITWIILAIVAVIALIYGVVAAINKATGTTTSALGVIVGALSAAGAFIWNLVLATLDLVLGVINFLVAPFISFGNFIANVFKDPIGSVIHLFGDMADRVLGIIESIAKAIDKVFGSNLAGAVSGWRNNLSSLTDTLADKYGSGEYEEKFAKVDLSSESLGLDRIGYGDAYNWGYGKGSSASKALSGINDNLNALSTSFDNVTDTDGKSVKTKNTESLLSDEDIQLLLDIATRDYKLSYQQITPNIQVSFGDVRETADVDNILDVVAERITEVVNGRLVTTY